MPGALNGLRVIDFGQYVAGPLTAMLLADQGADVIRIDPPGGPRWQTPANAVWNRGKRSICLDLKAEADREVAARLIADGDVVVENFRPGVMARLGLDDAAVRPVNPGLVFCSLPGFAAADPRATVRAWEGIVSAGTGLYVPRGGGDGRSYTSLPVASVFGAFLASTSIAMALVARERDGLGQQIEVPLFDAMFAAIGYMGLRFHDAPASPPALGLPWRGVHACGDGRWVDLQAVNQRSIDAVVRAAVLEGWREDGFADVRRVSSDRALAAEATRRLKAVFATRPAQAWEDLLSAAGVSIAVCRTSQEWLRHPHALAANLVRVADLVYGEMVQPGPQVRLSATPGEVSRPSSMPDADRETILAEIASERPASARPRVEQVPVAAALEGVRVLDLCIILAGPSAGRTLAEFGADVIKVDQPDREGGIRAHHDVNRGKRSLLLDLKTSAGMELFWQLVARAEVVLQNFRPGVAERLGVGYEQVRARRPDIVYVSLDTYGPGGPWSNRPGWDPIAAASSGMQRRFGGGGEPAVHAFALNDYGSGIMAAYGAAIALRHRRRTGEGQHVHTALSLTAGTLQSRFLFDFAGRTWDEVCGQGALGESPLQRLYRTSDAWVFLGATEAELPALASIEGMEGLDTALEATLAEFLETRFLTAPAATWVARLTAQGVAVAEAVNSRTAMESAWAEGRGLSITREHAEVGYVTTTGPPPRLSRTPVRPGRPAPPPGSDAESILGEVGRAADLGDLVQLSVVHLALAE
jgi:crotonobetainyl-CoA:carnitine CoA-transferase CaiB-like acyl-CoA transferase